MVLISDHTYHYVKNKLSVKKLAQIITRKQKLKSVLNLNSAEKLSKNVF